MPNASPSASQINLCYAVSKPTLQKRPIHRFVLSSESADLVTDYAMVWRLGSMRNRS